VNRLRRILSLVALSALFAPAQGYGQASVSPLVIGETLTIDSRVMHEVRRINVYMPPGYSDTTSNRVPVLYMPDGGMAEDFLHVAGLVQVGVGNGTMRPFLLVGIENTERRRDTTGPTENPEDRKIAPRVGGSALFREFIRTELMPLIKARYRTTNETAIVGESLAGLFVVETFLRQPDMFDTYIAFDPSLWWNNGKLVADAAGLLKGRDLKGKTLYVAGSSNSGLPDFADRLETVMRSKAAAGLEWHLAYLPGETHATIYHPAALQAFRLLFKPPAGQ
jgi:predicted alpha/beta superfamily hydrolase